jgi:hypothetical protein
MADHPEVEAIAVMFLSKQLVGVLSAMIINAIKDKPLRPDQNVRMFEIWSRVGMQLMSNNQRDVQLLDQELSNYARRLAHAQAAENELWSERTASPTDNATGGAGDITGDPGHAPDLQSR